MFINSTHFKNSAFFSHFSPRQIEQFISLGETKKFVNGEIFSLNRYMAYPLFFQGKVNTASTLESEFFGVFPFTRFSKIVQLRFHSPSLLYIWKSERIARFFQKNPVLIRPYLRALKEKGIILTNYGILMEEKDSSLFTFLRLNPKSGNSTSAWVYANLLKKKDRSKKILIIDSNKDENSSLFTKLALKLPLPANLSYKEKPFHFEDRIVSHKESGIDLLNFKVGQNQKTELFLIQNIIANAYSTYDYIIIDLPFNQEDENLSYILDNSSFLFYPVNHSGQILKVIRFLIEKNIYSGRSLPLPLMLQKNYNLPSNLHFIKKDTSLTENISSVSGEEKISLFLQNHLPPTGDEYALSLGTSLHTAFMFLGAIKTLSQKNHPSKVVAAGWSSFIGALYCLHKNAEDAEAIILRLISEFKERSFFEIVFPKNGLLKTDKLKSLLYQIFGDITFQDLKIPLTLRSYSMSKHRLVFIDSGTLVPALLSSLTMPGLLVSNKNYPGKKQELFGDYFYPDFHAKFYLHKIAWKNTIHFISNENYSSIKEKSLGNGEKKLFRKKNVFDYLLFPYLYNNSLVQTEFSLKESSSRMFYFSSGEDWKNIKNIPTLIDRGFHKMNEYIRLDESTISRFLKSRN